MRSEADKAGPLEKDNRTHEHGEVVSGESQNLLQGQARRLCRRINLIYCRSNKTGPEHLKAKSHHLSRKNLVYFGRIDLIPRRIGMQAIPEQFFPLPLRAIHKHAADVMEDHIPADKR